MSPRILQHIRIPSQFRRLEIERALNEARADLRQPCADGATRNERIERYLTALKVVIEADYRSTED